jgi:excisionase family DNA binding protein
MNDKERENIEPLLLSSEKAAKLLGISRTHFYGLSSSGTLGLLPVRLGGRTLWRREELEQWVYAGCPSRERWQVMRDKTGGN